MLGLIPQKVIMDVPALREFFLHGESISQRKAEAILQETEERTRSVLSASVDGVIETDESGLIEMINRAAENVFVCNRADVLGKDVTVLLDSASNVGKIVHEAMRDQFARKKAIISGSESSSGVMREVLGKRKNGTTFPMQMSICAGKVSGVVKFAFFVRDITESRMHEQLLSEERARADKLLLNVLPHSIAARLKANEKHISDGFDSTTVMFIDIVGFTAMSATMTPTKLVQLLNDLVTPIDRLAQQFRVEKIKTIGDCWMGVSGLYDHFHDHAAVALEFCLAVLKFLEDFNQERKSSLQFRIGVNSGPLVAGVIGQNKFAFDIWGDTVNTASRMESEGLPSRVQMSRSTYELVYQSFKCEERGEIEVKGKGKMTPYLLCRPAHEEAHPASSE